MNIELKSIDPYHEKNIDNVDYFLGDLAVKSKSQDIFIASAFLDKPAMERLAKSAPEGSRIFLLTSEEYEFKNLSRNSFWVAFMTSFISIADSKKIQIWVRSLRSVKFKKNRDPVHDPSTHKTFHAKMYMWRDLENIDYGRDFGKIHLLVDGISKKNNWNGAWFGSANLTSAGMALQKGTPVNWELLAKCTDDAGSKELAAVFSNWWGYADRRDPLNFKLS